MVCRIGGAFVLMRIGREAAQLLTPESSPELSSAVLHYTRLTNTISVVNFVRAAICYLIIAGGQFATYEGYWWIYVMGYVRG